jgi:hypothetical protein
MVDESAIGLDRLRISLDALPVQVAAFARGLPGPRFLPVFASLIPQMIVPYADAAALMLANFDRGNAMSRHRVGLALPLACGGGSRSGRPKSIPPGVEFRHTPIKRMNRILREHWGHFHGPTLK